MLPLLNNLDPVANARFAPRIKSVQQSQLSILLDACRDDTAERSKRIIFIINFNLLRGR
jgi:hypothetical protein